MARVVSLLVLLMIPSRALDAQTCDCVRTVAPCAGYWGSSAVFVGRVESVERSAAGQLVRFSVIEGFRGTSSSAVEVLTGPAGHRCAVSFRVGREYMVYASRSNTAEALSTSVCSRTRSLDDAAADVNYGRALKEGRVPAGSVGGQLLLAHLDLHGRSVRASEPLPDITVRVVKDGSPEPAVTNRGGDYAVLARGAGSYTVTADVPDRYYAHERVRVVQLAHANACAQVDITLYDNGRVSGRVVDATGRVVPGLTVELATTNLRQSRRTITDREGRFEIARVPPGRFVVRSGIGKLATVAQVTLGAGTNVTLDDVRLPSGLTYVSVSGFVLRPDGTPAEGARVYLKGAVGQDRILSEPVPVDFLGRFVIAALAGTDYRLFAELTAQQHVEASEQLPLKAAVASRPLRLVVRRMY
jgi:hypothetical protein